MKKRKNILVTLFAIILVIINSCNDSIIEPANNNLLNIHLNSSDSVEVKFDNEIICEGKISYNGSLGIAWATTYENIENGIHEIYYKSNLYNKEIKRKIYLEDTLTVIIYYSKTDEKVNFVTTTEIINIE